MRDAKRYQTIVVGVGGMGSATCYQLARRGQRVLGLERFDIPHTKGSSHGFTRIIRLPYYEHPSYVPLLKRAYELWHELEQRVEEKLLYMTGSLDAGRADSWVFQGARQAAIEHHLPHEVLSSKQITKRFPGYQFPSEVMGVYQPQGGFLLPERCIVSYVNAAIALGADIHGRERVLAYTSTPSGGVRVTTDRAVYEANSLILTAGAWNAHLLPFLKPLAVPERQVLAWFQPQRPEYFAAERFPVFNVIVPEGRFYGFPVFGIPGFKLGKYHHLQETGDPDTLLSEPTREDEELLHAFASRYFPLGSGPTMSLATCMFTNTPDGHFILDLHPQYPQISFASVCSGHGFKFVSVVGEIMADLAEHRKSRYNLELFRLERFRQKEES
jgi:sarcosine oxidase